MPCSRLLLFAFLVFFATPFRAPADEPFDRPHLRGPNYDGLSRETGLADSWPAEGPPVLWSRDLGEGYSSFIAVGGRLVTLFQNNLGMYVLALDADTGDEIWRARVDWPWQPGGAYPGPYATPTGYRDRIYYTTPTGKAGALRAGDGGEVWSVDLRRKFDGKGTEFGYAATPTLEDGRLYLPVGGRGASVVALDADDGSTLWAAGNDPASYCPIYPITFAGQRRLVAFLRNGIVLLDPASGQLLARQELSSHYDEHSAWPLYREPDLLFAFPFKAGSQSYRVEEIPTGLRLRPIWLSRELSNDVASSVLDRGAVYGFDLQQLQSSAQRASRGQFKCLDFATGKLRWKTDDIGQATALVADGKLILLNDTGTLILARANPDCYEELGRARVLDGGLCWTPPALWQGRLFLRNHARAVCLFVGKPDAVPRPPIAAPALRGTRFDWSELLGHEPEFPHDAPTAEMIGFWFAGCLLGVFGPAGLVALMIGYRRPRWAKWVFVAVAFPLGLAGTPLFGRWADTFLLTWPASLYLVFRVLIGVIGWAEGQPSRRKPRRVSRGVGLLFLLIGYGYYRLVLAVGYVMAWGFLAGFLPAAPLAILASRTENRYRRLLFDLLAFAVYFWSSGLLPGWKERNSID